MRRKFLSLIIAFVLLGSGLVFGACGKGDSGYKLSNLATDYTEQIDEISNINVLTDNTIEFDYSIYVYGGETYMSNVINSYAPYSYLQSFYNELLNNSMSFVYSYIDICSTNSIKAPKALREEAKSNLDKFVVSLKKTSGNVDAIADKIRKGNAVMESDCMNSLKNLFDSYDELYQSAYNFTASLTEIYYEYAYTDSNPDISNIPLNQYDASKSVLILKNRIDYQISNYTQSYIEIIIKGTNLSAGFTTVGNVGSLPANYNQYKTTVASLDVEIDDTLGVAVNESEVKEDFMNSAIELYNCLAILENQHKLYMVATNKVSYNEVINDVNATTYELDCVKIIINYINIIDEVNDSMSGMINILNSLEEV